MKTEVFKRTNEDWYPSYKLAGDYQQDLLVEVSFLKLGPGGDNEWRVCVWGADDCGMEKDFILESEAWNCFLLTIGQPFVTREFLINAGFVRA